MLARKHGQKWLRGAIHTQFATAVGKYNTPPVSAYVAPKKEKRDVIIVGGGHNGLVSAAYLAKSGFEVTVLERRHCVGGAAITEEIIPGFKFSRASYLAGLLRPHIIKDLELEKYGFKYLPRNPSSFTPTKLDSEYKGKYLLLGDDEKLNYESIAQFSKKDAEIFPKYEAFLSQIRDVMQPLIDHPPFDLASLTNSNLPEKLRAVSKMKDAGVVMLQNKDVLASFYELFTGPAEPLLNRWFESDILKTTLATDAVIGALVSPKQNGSAYVLLHHVMGEAAGKKGVWAYVQGGMGMISESICSSAKHYGAEIVMNAVVKEILVDDKSNRVYGVKMADDSVLEADTILSGISPYSTFIELMGDNKEGKGKGSVKSEELEQYQHHIKHTDFACGAFKINLAVNKLPNFTCYPSPSDGSPGPMHMGTIHFESHMHEIESAYQDAARGIPAMRPVIEMTIPSSVDKTISPSGQHVVQLFVQFAPYDVNPAVGSWHDEEFTQSFVQRVIGIVDEFAPGFSSSIIGTDALSPLKLEQVFGLHKGNIFHGSLSLHQLSHARPVPGYTNHRTPVKGLYLCASGTHPGGGVQGAPGYNCAQIVISDKLGMKALFK